MQNPLFDIAQDSTSPGVLSLLESDYRNADDILRLYLSALTGLDPTVVRKRWLQKPGTQPPVGIDWAAVGVERVETWGTPYQYGDKPQTIEDPDVVTRTSWQTLRCVASFYGENAAQLADTFREGLLLSQNDAQLRRFGMTTQGVEDNIVHLPDFLFEQWIDRYDVIFKVGRSVTRTFGVRTIVAAGVEIITEKQNDASDLAGQ